MLLVAAQISSCPGSHLLRPVGPRPAPVQGRLRQNRGRLRGGPASYFSLRNVGPRSVMPSRVTCSVAQVNRQQIDDKLSRRHLDLDPLGYFIIYIDKETSQIVAKHYKNTINDKGVACDPETGKPIPCDGSYKPTPSKIYRGYTAKELSVAILEDKATPPPVSMLVHANYLGREFQRAEAALVSGGDYMQD